MHIHCNFVHSFKDLLSIEQTSQTTGDRKLASAVEQTSGFEGITVAIIGPSGAGKTALLAKVAEQVRLSQQQTDTRPVIVRFCGTSPGSAAGLNLVRSICREIHFRFGYPLDDAKSEMVLSADYKTVVDHFHELMAKHAVVLLIDSLDQLTNADLARSDVSFLHGIAPHKDSVIIVSALPDEKGEDGKWIYRYGCDTTLKIANVPRVFVPPIETDSERCLIVRRLLENKKRGLTSAQWTLVQRSATEAQTALGLRLISLIAEQWNSYSAHENCFLTAEGVPALIIQIFEYFEKKYGDILVRAIFAFITFSVDGLSDIELEDLLSLHYQVMSKDGVNQYNAAERFPSHVWLRYATT